MLAGLLSPVLVVAALSAPQEVQPDDPLHTIYRLQIEPGVDVIEGRGPSAGIDWVSDFEGTLSVWATGEGFESVVFVRDGQDRILKVDDGAGGTRTPCALVSVEQADALSIRVVADSPGSPGGVELHLIAAPETEETRAAAEWGRDALNQVQRLRAEGRVDEARQELALLLDEIVQVEGSAASWATAGLLGAIGDEAHVLHSLPARSSGVRHLAHAALERALPPDHPDLLKAKHNLANSLSAQGDLLGARALREAVLEARERTLPEGHLDILSARNNLANSLHELGDLVGARALREAVLEGRERALPEDHPDVSSAKRNLANTLYSMGDLAGARALDEAVLEVSERTLPEDHPDLQASRLNLAISLSVMGDLAGARALREAVLEARERTLPGDHPDLLLARYSLANSLHEMGDLVGARALREAVLEVLERTLPGDHPEVLAARSSLAVSLFEMGDVAGARALWEGVLEAYERTLPEDHPELSRARNNLASALHSLGDLTRARALREQVLEACERTYPEDHPELSRARSNLATSLHLLGDLAGARALLPALCDGMRAHILASLTLSPRQSRQAVGSESYRLSNIHYLSESADPELQVEVFELAETLRLVAGEAARSLARLDRDEELAPILAAADEVRRELNDLAAATGRDDAGAGRLAAELTRLSLERDRLEGQASRLLSERGVVTRPVEVEALVAALEPNEALVGYRRLAHWSANEATGLAEPGDDHLLAHVLDAEGTLTRVDLGPVDRLADLASAWRAALGAPLLRGVALGPVEEDDPEVRAGQRLREALLDPILALAGEGTERLHVCADDLVFLAPLDALPMGDGRVGDRLTIAGEVSFARLMSGQEASGGAPSLLALGGAAFDADVEDPLALDAASPPITIDEEASGTRSGMPKRFPRLVQTRLEVSTLGDLFEAAFGTAGTVLDGADASKGALFAAAPAKRYVHLATHGWFAPESVKSTADPEPGSFARMGLAERVTGLAPMTLCGLALAGANRGRTSTGRVPGILTAEELCSLDLSQCELAVLSACETNVGIRRAGQGIQSLQAALYAAGARTSITSLWKVDDAATRKLMELFYANLWIEKMSKAEAIWQAKVALREAGHPVRDWAGWVLTGDPD